MKKLEITNIAKLRRANLISIAEASRLLGVTEATVRKWEKEGFPRVFYKVLAMIYLYDIDRAKEYFKRIEDVRKITETGAE